MSTKIKQIRNNTQMTQEEFSSFLGIPLKTLRNWEQGIRKPNDWTEDLIIDRALRYKLEKNMNVDEETGILSFMKIKRAVTSIAPKFDIDKIYLFGSYAKGVAMNTSDLDLYMESSLYGLAYFEFVETLREVLGKKIDLLSNRTVEENSKVYQEIKSSGVLIYER
jgi:predicted nucleotidyltransferase